MKTRMTCLALAALTAAAPALAQQKILQVKGSDTLVNLPQVWAETFTDQTGKMVAVTGGGSGTGIAALIDGKCHLANSSRESKQKEIDLAKQKVKGSQSKDLVREGRTPQGQPGVAQGPPPRTHATAEYAYSAIE